MQYFIYMFNLKGSQKQSMMVDVRDLDKKNWDISIYGYKASVLQDE